MTSGQWESADKDITEPSGPGPCSTGSAYGLGAAIGVDWHVKIAMSRADEVLVGFSAGFHRWRKNLRGTFNQGNNRFIAPHRAMYNGGAEEAGDDEASVALAQRLTRQVTGHTTSSLPSQHGEPAQMYKVGPALQPLYNGGGDGLHLPSSPHPGVTDQPDRRVRAT